MSIKRPLLVVTPTLGRSPWLYRTISSVTTYAGALATHVLVAPLDTLDSLRRRFPHCILVPDTVARGVYPAINLGIAHASNPDWKWFTWINDDDELMSGFVEHLARALNHNGGSLDAPWSYGQVQLSNGNSDDLGRIAVARSHSDIATLAQCGVNPFNQQGMLAPRAWVEKGGPLREDLRICADVDFWLKAVMSGANFRYSSETVALFRLRPGQISGDVTRHKAEFKEVVDSMPRAPRTKMAQWVVRTRFRLGNVGVYAGRIHRCGWKSGFALLEQPARKPS